MDGHGEKDDQERLEQEYARLSSAMNSIPEADTFHSRHTYRAEQLAVWIASVGQSNHPVGPSQTRPNPCVHGDSVVCSTFSPGLVAAFDRGTGAARWTLPLSYFGKDVAGVPTGDLVYCGTSQELLAVRAATGEVVWQFSPYGRKGETLYSTPTIADGRLFVGDRGGYLYCLDAATGETVWRVLTSRAANNSVNSDPLVADGVVAVGTNARLGFGFSVVTGEEVWRQPLDGPCATVIPAGDGHALFSTTKSVYQVRCADGHLADWRFFRNHCVDAACRVGQTTWVVTRLEWGEQRLPWPAAGLWSYGVAGESHSLDYPRWSARGIRYDPTTGRIYEATTRGLGIVDPRTGVREAAIDFSTDQSRYREVTLPWVEGDRLYLLDCTGRVHALRHP